LFDVQIAITDETDIGQRRGLDTLVPEPPSTESLRDLQTTFSLVLNRDVARAIVSTQFYTTTGRLCAAANTQVASLSAGTPLALTASIS
jgi:hypothetical protein